MITRQVTLTDVVHRYQFGSSSHSLNFVLGPEQDLKQASMATFLAPQSGAIGGPSWYPWPGSSSQRLPRRSRQRQWSSAAPAVSDSPAHAVEYLEAAPAVSVSPAPVVDYIEVAPAASDSPAPVVGNIGPALAASVSPVPVIVYIEPALAVGFFLSCNISNFQSASFTFWMYSSQLVREHLLTASFVLQQLSFHEPHPTLCLPYIRARALPVKVSCPLTRTKGPFFFFNVRPTLFCSVSAMDCFLQLYLQKAYSADQNFQVWV